MPDAVLFVSPVPDELNSATWFPASTVTVTDNWPTPAVPSGTWKVKNLGAENELLVSAPLANAS